MKSIRGFALFLIYALAFGLTALLTHWPEPDTQKLEAEAPVIFLSATEVRGEPGVYRWAVKTEETNPRKPVPTTPAAMADWPAPEWKIGKDTPRADRETDWFEVTGKVVLVKAEEDGDLHVQLANQYDAGPQIVVEIPHGKPWDAIRKEVFSWAKVKFPCKPHQLKLHTFPVIKAVGRAFWDGEHATAAGGSRRNYDDKVGTWELHPTMALQVVNH